MFLKNKQFIVFLISAITVLTRATTFLECWGGEKPYLVKISGCEKTPCTMDGPTKFNVTVDFIPKTNVTQLKHDVKVKYLFFEIPYSNITNTDASPFIFNEDGSKANFPLKANAMYSYRNEIHPTIYMKKTKAVIKFSLMDHKQSQMCFRMGVVT